MKPQLQPPLQPANLAVDLVLAESPQPRSANGPVATYCKLCRRLGHLQKDRPKLKEYKQLKANLAFVLRQLCINGDDPKGGAYRKSNH